MAYSTPSLGWFIGPVFRVQHNSPLFIASVQELPPLTYFPLAGPLYIFLIIDYFLISAFGLYLLFIERFNPLLSETKKKEINWVFWGILVAYLGGATEYPVNYGIPIYPIGNCFISAYMLFITYSILKYQSFDIKFIYKKSLVYTFLIACITVLYLAITMIIENSFKEVFGYKSFLLSLVVAITVGLLFIPLKNLLEKLIFKNSFVKIFEENESLRQEIIQSGKFKTVATLASGLAHEIKNPLTALKAFSDFLPAKIKDEEFLNKFAPIIRNEIERIEILAHNLLDFAKPTPVELRSADVNLLLSQMLETLTLRFSKAQISVRTQLSPNMSTHIDQKQFKQAILNLLLNAIDAMPDGGILTVITQKTIDNKLRVKISDTGTGIDSNDLPHIFEPFFSKKGHGTGLGLAITYEIIKNHNGSIFVDSKVGQGTTFTIELP